MGRKYLASLLAVAMFAAGVPCAQAEELDTNTANITDSQTMTARRFREKPKILVPPMRALFPPMELMMR